MTQDIHCLSLDCQERKSICCGQYAKQAHPAEMMLGVPEFYCRGCGKEFAGGKCTAGEKVFKAKIDKNLNYTINIIEEIEPDLKNWSVGEGS